MTAAISQSLLLLDQLRLPLLFGILGLFLLLLILRARWFYWIGLCLVSLPLALPILSHVRPKSSQLGQLISLPLKIVHQNCWGENPNTDAIFKQLVDTNADIIMLQECPPSLYWRIRTNLCPLGYALSSDFESYAQHHHHRSNRLVILTKGFKVSKRYKLKNQPVMVVQVKSFKTGERFRLVNVHLERCYNVGFDYYQAIAMQLGSFNGKTILTGDFNLVPWSKYYRDFCKILGLKDGLKGHGLIPSFPAPRNVSAGYKAPAFLPIDRLLVSPSIQTNHVERLPSLGSDHYGFIAQIFS